MSLMTKQTKVQDKAIAWNIYSQNTQICTAHVKNVMKLVLANVGSVKGKFYQIKISSFQQSVLKMALCFQVRSKERSTHDAINIPVIDRHKTYFLMIYRFFTLSTTQLSYCDDLMDLPLLSF